MSYGYQDILGPKNQTRKIRNILKDLELRRDLMHTVVCQNVSILPLWILLTIRIGTFWTEGIDSFVWRYQDSLAQKITNKKNDNIHKDFLNYTNFSCIIFYAKPW